MTVVRIKTSTGWLDLSGGGGGGGGGGDDASYIHNQSSPSATWGVAHGLGKHPSVTVVDSGESVVIPDIHYDNTEMLTIYFGSPTSGKAYLN